MRKIMFLLVALFMIPTCIFAATAPTITKLEADVSKKDIKYNGETTDGAYAVMCKLFNDKDEELDLLSSPVSENKFDGSFTVTENGKYKIACAIYEGGEFKTTEVTVNEIKEETKEEIKEETKVEIKEETKEEIKENPKTVDNIYFYVILGIISLISLGFIFYIKKKNN